MSTSSSHKQERKNRRIIRVRAKVRGSSIRSRLAVFRSLAHLSAQVIDDNTGRTLVAVHDGEVDAEARKGKKKIEIAALTGTLLAERAKTKGVSSVVFDRRDKRFHGRVRAFAEAARAGGLIF